MPVTLIVILAVVLVICVAAGAAISISAEKDTKDGWGQEPF